MKKLYSFLVGAILCSTHAFSQSGTPVQIFFQDFGTGSTATASTTSLAAALSPGTTSYKANTDHRGGIGTYNIFYYVTNQSWWYTGGVQAGITGHGGTINPDFSGSQNNFLIIDADGSKYGVTNGAYFTYVLDVLSIPGANYSYSFYFVNLDYAQNNYINSFFGIAAATDNTYSTASKLNSAEYSIAQNTSSTGLPQWKQYSLPFALPLSFTGSKIYLNLYNTSSSTAGGNDNGFDDLLLNIYTSGNISGTVYSDPKGDITSTSTYASSGLFAILVDNNNHVINTAQVSSGAFTFTNATAITANNGAKVIPYSATDIGLKVFLYSGTTAPAVGSTYSAANISPSTTQLYGTGNTPTASTTSVAAAATGNTAKTLIQATTGAFSGLKFYVNNTPTKQDINYNYPYQAAVNSSVALTNIQYTDVEDGTGITPTGRLVKIVTLPTNGTLQYNGANVTAGQVISNFDSNLLKFVFTGSGYTVSSFTFNVADASNSYSLNNSTYKITLPYPLPVNYKKELTATAQQNSILLYWETAQEVNNKEFNIYRSSDQTNWTEVATVASKAVNGNSTVGESYSWTDNAVISNTSYYYYLDQIDIDGTAKKSKIASLYYNSNSSNNTPSVYPNPVVSTLNLANASIGAKYRVMSFDGKVLNSGVVNASPMQIDLSGYASGNYFIQILNTNGSNKTIKFIKK